MDLKNYMDQHESIKEELSAIKKLTSGNDVEENAEAFVVYKDQYNTVPKILQNIGKLQSDTWNILDKIEKRIQKEERELYKLI